MKKNFVKVIFVSLFVVGMGYNVYQSKSEVNLSDLLLDNVEALARNENPDCPNGCVDDSGGCWCYTYYKYFREANHG